MTVRLFPPSESWRDRSRWGAMKERHWGAAVVLAQLPTTGSAANPGSLPKQAPCPGILCISSLRTCSMRVSLESRYGTCALPSLRALITLPSASRPCRNSVQGEVQQCCVAKGNLQPRESLLANRLQCTALSNARQWQHQQEHTLLMLMPSCSRWPTALVRLARSEPAWIAWCRHLQAVATRQPGTKCKLLASCSSHRGQPPCAAAAQLTALLRS